MEEIPLKNVKTIKKIAEKINLMIRFSCQASMYTTHSESIQRKCLFTGAKRNRLANVFAEITLTPKQ